MSKRAKWAVKLTNMSRKDLAASDLNDCIDTIVDEMNRQGFTRKRLAARANIGKNTISRWISRESMPRAASLAKVARALRLRLTLSQGN